MLIQYHTLHIITSAENRLLMSNPRVSLIRLWNAINTVMRGSMAMRAMLRRVSHPSRPVYCNTKTSHSVGKQALPSEALLFQKCAIGKSELINSNAYPSDHSAAASMSKQNDAAQDVQRWCQAKRDN